MHAFAYERPETLAEAVALLADHGSAARILAGGTDLIIRLRDGSAHPEVVIDIKRIPELRPSIRRAGDRLVISGGTVMTEVARDPLVRRHAPALAEAAAAVGSVQIRNRATLAGNICNASPAADSAPALLVHGAIVVAVGPTGERRIALDDFFVRSGVTTLTSGELVTGLELPIPASQVTSVHARRTRRRGHDLASVTLCVGLDGSGTTRVAYGSVGPRPILVRDEEGILADPASDDATCQNIFDRLFAGASPSPRSMRASPAYRLAMLRVLGTRALRTAHARRAALSGEGAQP